MTVATSLALRDPIPRVGGLPLLGALPRLLREQFDLFASAHADCGDLFTLELGGAELTLLCHPELAEELLVRRAGDFNKGGSFWDSARVLLGDGLVVAEGSSWRRQRRMIQPLFHNRRVAALSAAVTASLSRSLDELEELARRDGGRVRIDAWSTSATFEVLLATLFGTELSRDRGAALREALFYALDRFVFGMVTAGAPRWLPLPGRRRYREAIATIDGQIGELIEARRTHGPRDGDLLDLMFAATDEDSGEAMSDRQLRDELVTMFMAGYETTGAALGWAAWLLAGHGDWAAQLRAEGDRALAGRAPHHDDLPQLPCAKQVFEETLRLYPSSFWIPRMAEVDTQIGGHRFAKGQMLAASTYCIHRHPRLWPRPDRFEPDRFAPEQVAARHRLAFMPFGAGQRACIGRSLSMMQGQLALTMLCQRFELACAPGPDPQPKLSTTMTSKRGIHLMVSPRARA